LIALAAVIRRFGAGERSSRAKEHGPDELREMARRFNEMADNLARQRESQLALLGGIAHDLRNPLNALKLTTAQLAGTATPTEDGVRRAFDLVRRQIDRLARMVGDLMDMATIEAGKFDLMFEDHDLRQIALEVVELLRASTRDHAIVLRTPDDPVVTCCDATRISQVLSNLVVNGIKYSPPGSAVEIEVAQGAGDVRLIVTDHGIGIPTEHRRVIFDPFRRLDPATTRAPGAGLGLFVAALLVDAHGGRTELESEPGRGSRFTVILPRVRAEAAPRADVASLALT
jgi:signal transduction histidine kinase